MDGTSNSAERAIGWWVKERYRTMRGYQRKESVCKVSSLYATAYVLHAGWRVTLALFVHGYEALCDVLDDPLQRLRRLGVQIERLFMDREFASVAISSYLQEQPFSSSVHYPASMPVL